MGLSFVGVGIEPNSAVGKKRWCVFLSIVIVRAHFCVFTFSSTVNLLLLSSCTTVRVPSPFGLYARFKIGSKVAPSTPSPRTALPQGTPSARPPAATWSMCRSLRKVIIRNGARKIRYRSMMLLAEITILGTVSALTAGSKEAWNESLCNRCRNL